MKTQKQQLIFSKNSILELNNQKLASIKGGSASGQTGFFTSQMCIDAVSTATVSEENPLVFAIVRGG